MHCKDTLRRETRTMKSWTEMSEFDSFETRLKYLELHDYNNTSPRSINYLLYKNPAWEQVRREVIIRDNGYDLGVIGVPIIGRSLIHHINPLDKSDIEDWNEEKMFDLDNLVLVSYNTHSKIHYSLTNPEPLKERRPGDTKLW